MKISRKILTIMVMMLLAISVAACDGTDMTADETMPSETATETTENMDDTDEMAEQPSSEVPAEVIEEEPDPGISEQEIATLPIDAARTSDLLGHDVDMGDIAIVEMDEVEEAVEEGEIGEMDEEADAASGEISDILVSNDGQIQQVFLNVSEGFLDLDETTIALPWNMFAISGLENNDVFSDYHISFTGTADDIAAAPAVPEGTFDDDLWINPEEFEFMQMTTMNLLYLASDVSDLDLMNPADEDLGEVEDLIISVNEGVVSYAVVDFGGFLGMAETATAVPWSELALNDAEDTYVLDVTEEQLQNAPEIDVSIFEDNIFENNWDDEFAEFWNNLTDMETN